MGKVKRHPSDWEKILANDGTNKGSVSKTNRQFIELKKKANNPNEKKKKNQAGDLNICFSKEDIQMANKHIKRCSTLLIITKM